MKKGYILAIDQGTTGSRVILFNHEGMVHSMAYRELRQIYAQPGWVEHDPLEIWSSVRDCMAQALQEGAGRARGGPGDRHHQPAREHHPLGARQRASPVQLHLLAVPPERRHLRRAEGRRPRTGGDGEDRPGDRRLLLGHEDQVAHGQRAGGPGSDRARQPLHGQHRLLADLEPDGRFGARDRLLQRLPDDAAEHPQAGLGPGDHGLARDTREDPAEAPALQRGHGPHLCRGVRREGADRRGRGGPARGHLRPGLLSPRHGQELLRDGAGGVHEHRHGPGALQARPHHGPGLAHRGQGGVRAGRGDLHRRGGHRVAEDRPESHRATPPRPAPWPRRCRTPAGSTWCPPSSDWAPRTGTCTPGA